MPKRDTIIGNVYAELTVIAQGDKNKHGKYSVLCSCSCGNSCTVLEACLKNGHTKSCGCYKNKVTSERTRVDYTGIKSGRLLLIRDAGFVKNGQRMWECLCDCGKTHIAGGCTVVTGHTLSCGCLHSDNTKKANTTHGMSYSREYMTYNSMMERCYNPNTEKYPIYGDRGIEVCDEWRNSFSKFYEDMGDKPEGLTLERVDVNEGYCKENCMWDTPSEQAFNQRQRKDNTSGRVGVYAKGAFWVAKIWKDRKCYNLGIYPTFDEAVAAREAGEMKHYGYLKDKV